MSGSDFVEDQIPDPDELYEHLKIAIQKLESNSHQIPDADESISGALRTAKADLEQANEDSWELSFDPFLIFNLSSDRDYPNGNGQARLGTNIKVEGGEYKMFSSTLLLAIKEEEGEEPPVELDYCCVDNATREEPWKTLFHVLEQVHWDFDTGRESDEPKPACHFQVGGKIPDAAFNSDYEEYHYCSNGLDKPRIPHPPMGPILILNMLVDQYESLESFDQHEWRGMVRKGENTLWSPYYNTTHGMSNIEDSSIMKLMQPNRT